MRRNRIRGHCSRCGHSQLFERTQIHHGIHLLLSVLTLGLWVVSWMAIAVGHHFRPWRCLQCGCHKPIFNGAIAPVGAFKANDEKVEARGVEPLS